MNPLSWLSRTLRAPQSDEPVAEAPVVGAVTAGEIKEGQLIVRGWVHTAPGAAATVEVRFGAHAVAANLIVPEEEEAQPATTQFEARLDVSAVEQLSALQITSSLHDGKDRIPLRVSSLKPDIDKLQLKTKQHFFRNVQLPSTRVKDRQALTRLAQEGIAKFGSDPEVLASGLCVLIYGLLLDRGALSGPVLQYCLETEAHTQKVMAQIQGPKFVRWSSSIFIAYGYLFVRLARFEQAAAAFERVGVLAERLAEWPSIDVNVVRALYALGFIAYYSGRPEQARGYWQRGIQAAKESVALKDFSLHSSIGESQAALGVALRCSFGLAPLEVDAGNTSGPHMVVASRPLVPVEATPFLRRLGEMKRQNAAAAP